VSWGLVAGIFVFAAVMGLTNAWPIATLSAAIAAVLFARWMHRRRILALDGSASRALRIVSCLASLLALVLLARLAVFMISPSQVGCSFVPTSDWEVRHSCLSAYFVAAKAASAGSNIYADSLYSMPDDDPTKIRKARMLGPFRIDVYEYPPTFLLLPRALRLVTPEFTRFRTLCFGLGGGVLLIAFLVVARMLGPHAGTRALMLTPLVWVALPTLSVLQKGNVQAVVIAGSMLAMVLFERRRWAAGGALLAFMTASKLYPGLLIVYLLARRQWRAVAWTATLGVAFVALSIADTGWAPYRAFLGHLPGMVGGEAFPAFRNPGALAINFSVPGLVFKLKLFGVPGMGFAVAKIVGWIYTLVILAATILAARRVLREGEKPLVWIAILILATLRSPFLPQAYAAFPALWAVTLLAATYPPDRRILLAALLAWAALNLYWPMDWAGDHRLLAVANLIPQTLTIVVAVLALRRKVDPEEGGPSRLSATMA